MSDKALNIFFDASVLGIAQFDNAARTGIYRVVDALFSRLVHAKELNLHVTATEGLQVKSHLLNYLKKTGFENTTHLPPSTSLARSFGLLSHAREQVKENKALIPRIANQALWKAMVALTKYDRVMPGEHEKAIFHSTFWSIPDSVQRDPKLIKLLTVYDLWQIISRTKKETGPLDKILNSLPRDGWATCISEKTKEDFLAFRPDIDPKRVSVTYLGVDPWFRPADKETILQMRKVIGVEDRPYFLSVGTFSERKNLPLVLQAYFAALESGKLRDTRLVLVGAKQDELKKELGKIPFASRYSENIVPTGYLDDAVLPALYSGAIAFLYPSLYEGFGIPILEAMACHTPVLAADAGSIPEVAGTAARLLPPHDVDAWTEALSQIHTDDSYRKTLILAGQENCRRFSWENFSEATKKIYQKAYSS